MFEIGELVVYGTGGVFRVDDIRMEKFGIEKKQYYVLCSMQGGASSTVVFVPTDSEQLTSKMKPMISREGIEALIAAMPFDSIPWNEDTKRRAEEFRVIIESGDREKLLALMHTIYKKKQELAAVGRRIYAADENAMHRAERIIFDEFSAVLGIGDEEIIKMIEEKVQTA